jgi:hypothetical protein
MLLKKNTLITTQQDLNKELYFIKKNSFSYYYFERYYLFTLQQLSFCEAVLFKLNKNNIYKTLNIFQEIQVSAALLHCYGLLPFDFKCCNGFIAMLHRPAQQLLLLIQRSDGGFIIYNINLKKLTTPTVFKLYFPNLIINIINLKIFNSTASVNLSLSPPNLLL